MRRNSRIAALALAVLMILSAFSIASAEETVMGEDFYYIYTSEVGTLNHLVTNKTVDAEAIGRFVDPLINVDKFGGYYPGMALEWNQSEDGLTWTLKLREGVQWLRYDGTEYAEITAQDYVDAIEYIANPELASLSADMVLSFVKNAREYYEGTVTEFAEVGVKAIDKYTLEYTTYEPTPFFPSLLTYSCYLPVCKQFIEEEIGGMANFGTEKENYLFFGEFLMKDWQRDQEHTYVKNEKFYYADRVHIGTINLVMVQDTKVALEMYKRGEISAAPIVADQYDVAMADPELAPYVFRTSTTSASWYYHFNHRSPNANFTAALDNANFRKAIFSSLNRSTMLSISSKLDPDFLKRNTLNIWGLSVDENGKDYMTYGKLPEIEARDSFDADAAKEYLAKAKEELGDTVTWPLTIQLSTQQTDASMDLSRVMKQMIEEALGGDVLVEFATFTADQYYAFQEAGNYDMTSSGWSPDYADPSSYLEINEVEGYIGKRLSFGNSAEWQEFDAMMKEGKTKTVLSERFEIFAKAEAYIIENALVLPYRANGGNYSINNMINPYDALSSTPYGLCAHQFRDRIYGEKPLTVEERKVLKAEFDAEKAAK